LEVKDIFVKDALGMEPNWVGRWKVSLKPMMIVCQEGIEGLPIVATSFPLINMTEDDAFWEMIIGQDVWEYALPIINTACNITGRTQRPTPGPSYSPDDGFMGHNVRFAKVSEIPAEGLNEFLEFNCSKLFILKRLAINRASRQLVMWREGSNRTFLFDNLPMDLEEQLESMIFDNPSEVATVLELIAERCNSLEVETFPSETILVDWQVIDIQPSIAEEIETATVIVPNEVSSPV
jgi:hypothetical protein